MLLLAGTSLLAFAPAVARAQAATGMSTSSAQDTTSATAGAQVNAAETSSTADTLGDIVVTGEKRETNLQTAPLAITAIGGDKLLQNNVNQLADLNGLVAGLTIAKNEGAERVVAIRGIGYETAQNPNSQPGVAFHIDGVYIAHVMSLNQDLLDVDHVEVLRGPQGTVFGQASTGGAINVITHRPVIGEASGSGSASYGNYNYVKAEATVNIPVSDTVAMRAAVQYLSHDGYGHATAVPGRSRYDLDDANDVGARASLLWQPTDSFSAQLSVQAFSANHNAAEQKNVLDADPDPRDVTQDYPGKFRIKNEMVYLTLAQQIGDMATLKSVSAYQYMDKHQSSDNDRLASPFYYDHITYWRDESKAFTEEVSLQSKNNTRFQWTIGGFYLRQRANQNILEQSTFPAVTYQGIPVKYAVDGPYQHTSYAGYGQASYALTDALTLIAGVRYSHDKTTAQPVNYFNLFGATAPRKATSDAFTGKVGAEFHVARDNLLYVTGSKGYKPTGVNFNQGAITIPLDFKKETVYSAEVGSKNEFFDRKVRLNVAGFYYWYRNFQFTADDPFPNAGGTANIPRARIYGAEFEGSVLPVEGLRFDGTLSLGKGRFKGDFFTLDTATATTLRNQGIANLGYFNPYDPSVIALVATGIRNTNGNRVPKLPGVLGNISVTYTAKLAAGELTLRGEGIYRGHYVYRVFNNSALDRVPSYKIANAYVSFHPANSALTFSVSGLNLFDKAGVNSRFTDPYGSGTTSTEYIAPRQVFGTLAFAF